MDKPFMKFISRYSMMISWIFIHWLVSYSVCRIKFDFISNVTRLYAQQCCIAEDSFGPIKPNTLALDALERICPWWDIFHDTLWYYFYRHFYHLLILTINTRYPDFWHIRSRAEYKNISRAKETRKDIWISKNCLSNLAICGVLPIDHFYLDIASMPYKRHDFMNIDNGAALSCIFIFVYKILIW